MGNTTTTRQSQSANPTQPAGFQNFFNELRSQPLFNQFTNQGANTLAGMANQNSGGDAAYQGALSNLGQLSNTGGGNGWLNNATGIFNQYGANQGTNAAVNSAERSLGNFSNGTPGQPSSATNAALQEFKALQAPEILQQAALMGQGNSGAALSALAQGQEQALVPFMQQDLSNQLSAAGQLGQFGEQNIQNQMGAGQALAGIGQGQIGNQLNATNSLGQLGLSGIQNRQGAAQSLAGIGQGNQSQVASLISSLFGQNQTGSTKVSGPKF